MANQDYHAPVAITGVTVSSTFTDLKEHRAALIGVIRGQGLAAIAMENDGAKPGVDLIDSSLQMVRQGFAYIGIISRKYGQTPKCPTRNPKKLSITELEFNEAQRLDRPILLFIMGKDHPIREADVEPNRTNKRKLSAFRERAKEMSAGSSVHRVYAQFDSLEEFKEKAAQSIAALRRHLDEHARVSTAVPSPTDEGVSSPAEREPIPTPPALHAEPPYIGSHTFVGRRSQLETLSDWAAAADPHPVLLFEAIGGTGKSMLTWQWVTEQATTVRGDWAGRFWYSFYEKGAIMADFCRRALAYITGRPREDFRKKKTAALGELLLRHLQARPWLLVLDGLERVLVAYHRFDAAQLLDEEAGTSDEIAHRDPCSAIRPEDDDLLRMLAGAAPSKLLLTTRLTPRVLLNAASQPIPGVLRERLPGLRPADAEALIRSCDVRGTSEIIQQYLQAHCDCHPLVTGVVAGLVNDYLPDRGNFDAWASDPDHGGRLDLASLNLVQKRNHILHTALSALPEKSRQLLSTLALLSEAADFATMSALNPHLPSVPDEVEAPDPVEDRWDWDELSDQSKAELRAIYAKDSQLFLEYEMALAARLHSPEYRAAPRELAKTVSDLEKRGLLQYDHQTKRHDLHPVVRGIAAGSLRQEEKEHYGQRVVDHFSQQTHNPYAEAETLEDVSGGIQIVRTLLQMGRREAAFDAYRGDLSESLLYNLEAKKEMLELIRPFFTEGWSAPASGIEEWKSAYLVMDAATALNALGQRKEAVRVHEVLIRINLKVKHLGNIVVSLLNHALADGSLSREARNYLQALEIATLVDRREILFYARLENFFLLSRLGRWEEAETIWNLLDPMGREWMRVIYQPGNAERYYALFRFWQGLLTEEHIARAEELSRAGRSRLSIRMLYSLRGEWELERGTWELAANSLHEAVRMAHEIGLTDTWSESLHALARHHLGQLPNAREEADRLATRKDAYRPLAELWLAIGDVDRAKEAALAAYEVAWADGEPYVWRYELNRATALLKQLGVEIPQLPPYDPDKHPELPWEMEVTAVIAELRAEKEAKQAATRQETTREPDPRVAPPPE